MAKLGLHLKKTYFLIGGLLLNRSTTVLTKYQMMNQEIKHFFNENNNLNKGFLNNRKSASRQSQEFEDILPASEVLAVYEEIMPGTMAKLLDLTEQEQVHQHALEQSKMLLRARFEIIGKLFFVLTIAIIGYVTINLAQNSLNHAVIFSSIAFLSILGMSLISYFGNLHFKNSFRNYNTRSKQSFSSWRNNEKSQSSQEPLEENKNSSLRENSRENSRDRSSNRRPIYKRKK